MRYFHRLSCLMLLFDERACSQGLLMDTPDEEKLKTIFFKT